MDFYDDEESLAVPELFETLFGRCCPGESVQDICIDEDDATALIIPTLPPQFALHLQKLNLDQISAKQIETTKGIEDEGKL